MSTRPIQNFRGDASRCELESSGLRGAANLARGFAVGIPKSNRESRECAMADIAAKLGRTRQAVHDVLTGKTRTYYVTE
jgi:hypothetical protein